MQRGIVIIVSLLALGAARCCVAESPAEGDDGAIEVEVEAPRMESYVPGETFSSLATELRFAPLVDLEARNQAEAQGDLVIRGGTFETSGIQIGASSLYDPQTGHYLLELPIDPRMMGQGRVQTGFEQALTGFNADSGSVRYDFSALEGDRLALRTGVGDDETNVQEAYGALGGALTDLGGHLGMDLSLARSESDGSRDGGDSDYDREAGRLQWRDRENQTDLLVGTQRKNFSWPYLYALQELHEMVGSSGVESEELRTSFAALNHHYQRSGGSTLDASVFARRNHDDYEFDRYQPGLFNPFRHTTRMLGGAALGNWQGERFEFRHESEIVADDLESTALAFGPFQSRTIWKVGAAPGIHFQTGEKSRLTLRTGAAYLSSNREGGRASPLGNIEWRTDEDRRAWHSIYADISQNSQLPGYTALCSNPTGGLFRGNPRLARTVSTNYETGVRRASEHYSAQAAAFYRTDQNLVDWTFQSGQKPFSSRTAENVDVRVEGFETELQARYDPVRLITGYQYLNKDADYKQPVDASFYALNYPRHRVAGAIAVDLPGNVTFRVDNELRRQVPNELRDSRDRLYYLGSISLKWNISESPHFSLMAIVDNFTNENFEEVPGVPGVGRTAAVFGNYEF